MKMSCLAALILALTLALAGCGGHSDDPAESKKDPAESSKKPASSSQEQTDLPKVYDDSLIEEAVHEKDIEDEDAPEKMHLSYWLPQIKDDSQDAEDFNASLQEIWTEAEKGDFYYDQVRWESHWNDSLLSLIVTMRAPFEPIEDYFALNYDFEEHRAITGEELMERLDATPEEAETAMRRAAAHVFDASATEISKQDGDCTDALWDLRAQTIGRKNLNLETTPVYLNDDGEPHAFAAIGTPAGGGSYNVDLSLDLKPEGGVRKTVEREFIKAELANNSVTLTFADTEFSRAFMGHTPVKFHSPYPVEGLYGEYTDMEVGFIGNGGDVFLFLTDTNGCVTFCDIFAGLEGTPRFSAVGPVYDVTDVKSYEVQQDEDGFDVCAKTGDGSVFSLWVPLTKAESVMPSALQKSSWYAEDARYSMSFGGEDYAIKWAEDGNSAAIGFALRYLGMTEEGQRFRVDLETPDLEYAGGYLTLSYYMPGMWEDKLTYTQVSGTLLPGIPEDGIVVMDESMG